MTSFKTLKKYDHKYVIRILQTEGSIDIVKELKPPL